MIAHIVDLPFLVLATFFLSIAAVFVLLNGIKQSLKPEGKDFVPHLAAESIPRPASHLRGSIAEIEPPLFEYPLEYSGDGLTSRLVQPKRPRYKPTKRSQKTGSKKLARGSSKKRQIQSAKDPKQKDYQPGPVESVRQREDQSDAHTQQSLAQQRPNKPLGSRTRKI